MAYTRKFFNQPPNKTPDSKTQETTEKTEKSEIPWAGLPKIYDDYIPSPTPRPTIKVSA